MTVDLHLDIIAEDLHYTGTQEVAIVNLNCTEEQITEEHTVVQEETLPTGIIAIEILEVINLEEVLIEIPDTTIIDRL